METPEDRISRAGAEIVHLDPAPPPKPKHRFPLVRFDQIGMASGDGYLVKGLIPREGLVIIWGPPKCGKSFWVCDLVLHAALGWRYRNRRVVRGAVVYVCLEGERGIGNRIEAFRRENPFGAEMPLFYLLPTRLDLASDVQKLIDDIKEQVQNGIEVVAVVLDTLNRSLAGSESSDEDMGAYVRACDRIRAAFRCAVLVVHHCGHEATRPRGHTSLLGAADAQIAVKRDAADLVIATVEYMKDGPSGTEIASRLKVIELGEDGDGDPITSCVVEPAEGQPRPAKTASKPLSPTLKLALEKFDDLMATEGKPAPASNHIPAGHMVIDAERWRQHLRSTGAIDRDGAGERQGWKRAREGLIAAGRIAMWETHLWRVRDSVTKCDKP